MSSSGIRVTRMIDAILRGTLLFSLLVGAVWTFDVLLFIVWAIAGPTGGRGPSLGMPVPYSKGGYHDDWLDEPTRSTGPSYDGSAIAFDLIVVGVLAIIFTFLLHRALRADALAHPRQPPRTTEEDPEVRALRRRSHRAVLLVVIGSLLGLGLFAGPLGWSRGARLRHGYHLRCVRPSWTATTSWVLGLAVVVTVIVCTLGLILSTVH